MSSIYHLGPLMNVCPEWLCGVVRGAQRARNDSRWKEKGGVAAREGARWKDEREGHKGEEKGRS